MAVYQHAPDNHLTKDQLLLFAIIALVTAQAGQKLIVTDETGKHLALCNKCFENMHEVAKETLKKGIHQQLPSDK